MDEIPLPTRRTQPIDGAAILRSFLEGDEAELPTDPEELRAFASEIVNAVDALPANTTTSRGAKLTRAQTPLRAKVARFRGGKTSDHLGSKIDDVVDFIGGLQHDAGQAIGQSLQDGAVGRGLGGLAMLAASVAPGALALGRNAMRASGAGKVLDEAESVMSRVLPDTSGGAISSLGRIHGALDDIQGVMRPNAHLMQGGAIGATASAGTAAALGETDPASLAIAAGAGSVTGGVADRLGSRAGQNLGFNHAAREHGYVGTPAHLRARLDTSADALEDRLPDFGQQLEENLALERRLQRQEIQSRHKSALQQQKQKSSERLGRQGGPARASQTSRSSQSGLRSASILERLNAGDLGQLQAPQTFGTLSPQVAEISGRSTLADIGREAAKNKAASTRQVRRKRIEKRASPGKALSSLRKNSPVFKQAEAELRAEGLTTRKARAKNSKKASAIVDRVAREHGISSAALRKAIQKHEALK